MVDVFVESDGLRMLLDAPRVSVCSMFVRYMLIELGDKTNLSKDVSTRNFVS